MFLFPADQTFFGAGTEGAGITPTCFYVQITSNLWRSRARLRLLEDVRWPQAAREALARIFPVRLEAPEDFLEFQSALCAPNSEAPSVLTCSERAVRGVRTGFCCSLFFLFFWGGEFGLSGPGLNTTKKFQILFKWAS